MKTSKTICLLIMLLSMSLVKASDLAKPVDSKSTCLKTIAIQCPSLWGASSDSLKMSVMAGIPGAMEYCVALKCIYRFTTSFDKCVMQKFYQDPRLKKLTPDMNINQYTEITNVVLNNAKGDCSSIMDRI